MRIKSSLVTKVISGAMAIMMTLSCGANAVYADEIDEKGTEIVTEIEGEESIPFDEREGEEVLPEITEAVTEIEEVTEAATEEVTEAVTEEVTEEASEVDLAIEDEDLGLFDSVAINQANFPDANFRAVVSADFDKDGNGYLDSDEIRLARNLWCVKKGIKSLKGIEYLVELRGIYCMDNQISSWDLSHNKLLTGIWCSGNLFTSLDFSNLPNLEWVYCFDCKLTSLNVSNNPKMSYIECNSNPLGKIDVSKNPLLEHLMCGDCGLTSLDLSNNPNMQHLDAFRNKFKTLDVTCCPKMKRLDIWDCPNLGSVDVSKCPGLQTYNCSNNNVTSIDVSHNPELTKLICSYNRKLTKVDVSKNPKLFYLDCNNCNIQSLDVSNNPRLRFLQVFTNPFTSLNIGDNPYLLKTYKEGKKVANEPNAGAASSWKIDYGGDTSTGGDNIYFLCFDHKVKLSTTSSGKYVGVTEANYYSDYDTGVADSELIKREEAVQVLYKMAGSPSVSGKSRFKDVKSGSSYEKAVIWAEKNAMVLGFPDVTSDNFGVGKWATRQDLCLMLMRYSEVMGLERAIDFGRSDDYMDYYDIDYDWWEAICWAATWHIMEGKGEPGSDKSEQVIDPRGKATRVDFQLMLNNLYEVNKLKGTPPKVADISSNNNNQSSGGNNQNQSGNDYLVFKDVTDPSKFYYDAVYWAYEHQITTSSTDQKFRPNQTCTRAEFVTFLWRAAGRPSATKITKFDDVKSGSYYYDAVMWAASYGITTGYKGTNTFGVNDPCTREQCVTFLYRFEGKHNMSSATYSKYSFKDVKKTDFSYEAIVWAASTGITNGTGDNKFSPKDPCTRGMLVTLLYRYYVQ